MPVYAVNFTKSTMVYVGAADWKQAQKFARTYPIQDLDWYDTDVEVDEDDPSISEWIEVLDSDGVWVDFKPYAEWLQIAEWAEAVEKANAVDPNQHSFDLFSGGPGNLADE